MRYKVGDKLKAGSDLPNSFKSGEIYEIALEKKDGTYLIFNQHDRPKIFLPKEIKVFFELQNDDNESAIKEEVSFSSKSKNEFGAKVEKVLSKIGNMLIEKNRKYGNSALEPVRIFSNMPKDEQIKVRIDDKLSRISNSQSDEDEDVINDLIGYLVLLKIAKE